MLKLHSWDLIHFNIFVDELWTFIDHSSTGGIIGALGEISALHPTTRSLVPRFEDMCT